MSNAKSFASHAILLMILGTFYLFFYSGLQNDHINVLMAFLPEAYGWGPLQITYPITVAALVSIVLYLIVGAAMVKYGVRAILVPSIVVLALACVGLAVAGDNYSLYAVSLFLVRALVVPLQLGGFMLVANWFIKYRGRVLGVITAGGPVFTAVGLSAMFMLLPNMGMNLYIVIAAILIALALLTAFGIKDTPEQMGVYPDGADHKPISEQHESREPIVVKKLLSEARAWQLIISYGILQFVIVAMMAYMTTRYASLNIDWNSGVLPYLSVGALLGIPMSFVLGWIDDKLGSIKASLLLNILFFVAVIPLAIMPEGGSPMLLGIWAFGVSCMVGGLPTMHPCITSYAYGRHHYMEANKWIMTIQAIPMAVAVTYMSAFDEAGNLNMAYYIMIGLLVVSFITILTMRNLPDANAEDRDYIK